VSKAEILDIFITSVVLGDQCFHSSLVRLRRDTWVSVQKQIR